ncbi:hypothetical protein QWY82_19770 [Simiduia curdlanivorans]|uniref:Histidine kinase n=1 Tax=Simiduia curdlanivorans TaxID=1492769 RepID=A0ABV8V2R6_9GAMM|nr:hypothetical protein [Simiduia curdlanivorans]MDN3641048.1 hypothetical protein [Simiduia curdlanivorans]
MTSEHSLHRLRNLLNNISVNTELARLQVGQQQPTENVLASLDKVMQACKECALQLEQNRDAHD